MKKMLPYLFVILLSTTPVFATIVNGVACRVGSDVITVNEFKTAYEREKKQAILTGMPVPSKKTVIDSLIDNLIVTNEAGERGIVVTTEEINGMVKEIREQNKLTEEQFQEELKKENMGMDDLKEMIRGDLFKNRIISTLISERRSLVSDQEIREFYDDPANNQYFVTPATVWLAQLFIPVPEDAPYKTVVEIKNLALKIADEASGGVGFADLAAQYADGPVKVENRGSIGSFSRGQLSMMLPADQVSAIFSLEKGRVSQPLRTSGGYSILRIEKRIDEKQLAFDDARENIKSFLLRKKGGELFQNWLAMKRNTLRIEYMIDLE
jgi:parvulin-like peptidyl-prolyl isomerase